MCVLYYTHDVCIHKYLAVKSEIGQQWRTCNAWTYFKYVCMYIYICMYIFVLKFMHICIWVCGYIALTSEVKTEEVLYIFVYFCMHASVVHCVSLTRYIHMCSTLYTWCIRIYKYIALKSDVCQLWTTCTCTYIFEICMYLHIYVCMYIFVLNHERYMYMHIWLLDCDDICQHSRKNWAGVLYFDIHIYLFICTFVITTLYTYIKNNQSRAKRRPNNFTKYFDIHIHLYIFVNINTKYKIQSVLWLHDLRGFFVSRLCVAAIHMWYIIQM